MYLYPLKQTLHSPSRGLISFGTPLVHPSNAKQVIGLLNETLRCIRYLGEGVGWIELATNLVGLQHLVLHGMHEVIPSESNVPSSSRDGLLLHSSDDTSIVTMDDNSSIDELTLEELV